MEILNIYGDNRAERHTKVREACRGILVKDGMLLLSYAVKPDQWMIPGGGVEAEESLESCCARELAEETGFRMKPLHQFLTINEYYEEYLYRSHYYICEMVGQSSCHLTQQELEAGMEPRWIPLDKAVSIFFGHQDIPDEEKRGMYLREYQALMAYQNWKENTQLP